MNPYWLTFILAAIAAGCRLGAERVGALRLRESRAAWLAARFLSVAVYLGVWLALLILPVLLTKTWSDFRNDPLMVLLTALYAALVKALIFGAMLHPATLPARLGAFHGAAAAQLLGCGLAYAAYTVMVLIHACTLPPESVAAAAATRLAVAMALDLTHARGHGGFGPGGALQLGGAAAGAAAALLACSAAGGAAAAPALLAQGALSGTAGFLNVLLVRTHGFRATNLALQLCTALFTLVLIGGALFYKDSHTHWIAERRKFFGWSVSVLIYFILSSCLGIASACVLALYGNVSRALLGGVEGLLLAFAASMAAGQPMHPLAVLAGVGGVGAWVAWERGAATARAGRAGEGGGDASDAPRWGAPAPGLGWALLSLPLHDEPRKSHGASSGGRVVVATSNGSSGHAAGQGVAAAALPPPSSAADGPAWARMRLAAALVALGAATPLLLRAKLQLIPPQLQLRNFLAAGGDQERPHDTCAFPPLLNSMVARAVTCPVNPPYYSFEMQAGRAVLASSCAALHDGVGSYQLAPLNELNTVREHLWPRLLKNATTLPFPSNERIIVPIEVTTVRVMCRLRNGHKMDEFAMVPGNMAARMDANYEANAARAPPPRAADAGAPNVLVVLMDAMSRHLANAIMTDTTRLFREQRLSTVTAFEFDHFSVVNANSLNNWGAMFCNAVYCDDVEQNLFEHAARARMNTIVMNNFCVQRPVVKGTNSNFTLDGANTNGFICLRGTGMTESCVHGESVSRSFVTTTRDLVLHAHAQQRRFIALVAPHESHMLPHGKLLGVQPHVIQMLKALDAAGALSNTITLYLADHGIHYDNSMATYAPAAYSHHNPVLFALVGNEVLSTLPAGAMRTLLLNRGRMVSMHDVFTTLGTVVGVPPALFRPGTYDLLRQVVPANRTCAQAYVQNPEYCNCFGPDRRAVAQPFA